MARPKTTETCSHDGCDREAKKRGFCGTHYLQWWRSQNGKCMRETCSNAVHARGLCQHHYDLSKRSMNDIGGVEVNFDHPQWEWFFYKMKPYEGNIKYPPPSWEMPHNLSPDNPSNDGWEDVPMNDRPAVPRKAVRGESVIVDHSTRRK